MNPPVDVFIPAAPKDYNKLPFVIESVQANVEHETIHLATPSRTGYDWPGVVEHRDSDVLGYNRNRIPFRPNWTFQQLLKLFQNVTASNWYLVLDADIIINQPLPLWNSEDRRPILYVGRDQEHGAYFEFNKQILGFGKTYPHSFLSECTLYNKLLIKEMLDFAGLDLDGFFEKLIQIIHIGCCPAESELYGSFLCHEHLGAYDIQRINSHLGGRYRSHIWTEQQITDQIEEARRLNPKVHLISFHSWEGG